MNFSCTNNLIEAEPTQIQDGLGLQSFGAYKIRPQRTLQANEWIGWENSDKQVTSNSGPELNLQVQRKEIGGYGH